MLGKYDMEAFDEELKVGKANTSLRGCSSFGLGQKVVEPKVILILFIPGRYAVVGHPQPATVWQFGVAWQNAIPR